MKDNFDTWFEGRGPAAIVLREYLAPVEGPDGVFFPATYAPQQGHDKDKSKFQGGYNIDVFEDGSNVVLVDSVGSQANRIEPIFAEAAYSDLVPQIVVTFPSRGLRLNILNANHRAADAIIRCSGFENDLREAFQQVLRGNAEKLAQIAPTSLVFGAWDSRVTQAKLPRLFSSTIRAFNVRQHTRSANFLVQLTVDLEKLELLPEAGSEEGFKNALASKAPGGVQLTPNGFIRRDTVVNLAALRRLSVLAADGSHSVDRTKSLRRYILGLALVALTAPQESFLRSGCNLVPDLSKAREFVVVGVEGERTEFNLNHEDALTYTRNALRDFDIRKTDLEKEFSSSSAEKAAQGQPEKLKKQEVVAVNAGTQTFCVKGRDAQIGINGETTFKKGRVEATFGDVVQVGAILDIDVLLNVAKAIKSK